MTTTSTFQGMNTDTKPSSRVLNPPGGASSNIFGSADSSAPQRTPIKNNPDNINRSNNDIFHQGIHPAESTPTVRNAGNVNRQTSDIFNQGTGGSTAQASKSRAPRSGEDSFHSLYGTRKNVELEKNENCLSSITLNSGRRRNHTSPDTYSNVFGDTCSVNRRNTFRKYSDKNSDSFSRIFGDADFHDNFPAERRNSVSHDSFTECGSSFNSLCSTPVSSKSSSSHSVNSIKIKKEEIVDKNSSFERVFGKLVPEPKPNRLRRFCDTSAYNPITGEAYEQTNAKQEQTAQYGNTQLKSNEPPVVDEVKSQDDRYNYEEKDHKTNQACDESQGGVFGNGPAIPQEHRSTRVGQDDRYNYEEKDHKTNQACDESQGGVFGYGPANPQEHRSTRVSQPPGGRSTKLW